MFSKQSFIQSVYDLRDIPKLRLPEIILCGRSNVGKSSFINSLFNRKDLAKISSTPGKTRSINYYLIESLSQPSPKERAFKKPLPFGKGLGLGFYIVDLPGYGYAKASLREREKWGKLVSNFISKSEHIALACHFIDSRHKPTELDKQLNSLLKHYNLPYVVILSKVDKLKQSEMKPAREIVLESLPELKSGENLFVYSAVKKTGKKEILSKLSSLFY